MKEFKDYLKFHWSSTDAGGFIIGVIAGLPASGEDTVCTHYACYGIPEKKGCCAG